MTWRLRNNAPRLYPPRPYSRPRDGLNEYARSPASRLARRVVAADLERGRPGAGGCVAVAVAVGDGEPVAAFDQRDSIVAAAAPPRAVPARGLAPVAAREAGALHGDVPQGCVRGPLGHARVAPLRTRVDAAVVGRGIGSSGAPVLRQLAQRAQPLELDRDRRRGGHLP